MVNLKSVMKKSLVDFIRAAGLLCFANIIWAILNLAAILLVMALLKPVNLGDYFLVLFIMIVPSVLSTLGIMHLAGRIARNEDKVSYRDMFKGLVVNWKGGLLIALANIVVVFFIMYNSFFYLGKQAVFSRVVGGLWIYLAVIWLTVQLYQMALVVNWEKSYLQSFRLALKMVVKNLFLNNTIFIIISIIFVLSFPAGLIFLWVSLTSIIINNAVEQIRQEMFPEEYENRE